MELHKNYKFYTRVNHSVISFDLNLNEEKKLIIKDFDNIYGPWIEDVSALGKINEVINSFCLDEIEYNFIELPNFLR